MKPSHGLECVSSIRARYLVAGLLRGIHLATLDAAESPRALAWLPRALANGASTDMGPLFATLSRLVETQPRRLYPLLGPALDAPSEVLESSLPPRDAVEAIVEKPDQGDEQQRGEPGGEEVKDGGGVRPPPSSACPALTITPVRVNVIKATYPHSLKDDVAVNTTGGLAFGQSALQQGRFPPEGRGDSMPAGTGEFVRPTSADIRVQAVHTADGSCYVDAIASISLREVDAGETDRALKEAAAQLSRFASSLGAVGGAGAMAGLAAAQQTGLIDQLINAVLDLVGLGDDWMGAMNFRVMGELSTTTPVQSLSWTPEPSTSSAPIPNAPIQYSFPTDRTAELTQKFTPHSGEWELVVQVVRNP